MNIVDLSIKRPIFMSCIAIVFMVVGLKAYKMLGVDLFPDVTIPVVSIKTTYQGAAPREIETQVTKYIEDEVNTISGLKRITSENYDSLSVVIAEFKLGTDVKYAEQEVRNKVSLIEHKLPDDADKPIIERVDPNDQPVIVLALKADGLSESELYDVADLFVKTKLEQVNDVGSVDIIGGRQREIHVILDRDVLKERELSASAVSQRLSGAGENISSGKVNSGNKEIAFKSLGEFGNLKDVGDTVINLYNNDNPTRIKDIATVEDTLEDESSRVYMNGEKVLTLRVFKQSGTNTLAVVNGIKNNFDKINSELSTMKGSPRIELIRDGGRTIQMNVNDVFETIIITIILTIIVIYLFLQSVSSTFIVSTAIPVALIGAFALMLISNFTVNIISLLALSLAVGMVIDDAILIKENVYRHAEMGYKGKEAASIGSKQVFFAVLATSSTLLAVYVPVAFMKGVIGQFLKQFGLVIAFTTIISTLNAITMSPMLSAYLPDKIESEEEKKRSLKHKFLSWFDALQSLALKGYLKVLNIALKAPLITILIAVSIFFTSIFISKYIPKTFLPTDDSGEFVINFELPAGSNVEATSQAGLRINDILKQDKIIDTLLITVGGDNEVNKGNIYVKLIPFEKRKHISTTQEREKVRQALSSINDFIVQVTNYSQTGSSERPFSINLVGYDMDELKKYANLFMDKIKSDPRFVEPDTNYRDGKPELQIDLLPKKAEEYGITTSGLGSELKAEVEGLTPAKYKINGNEYDIRVRLKEEQRHLNDNFDKIYIPNINNRLIKLSDVATANMTIGASVINRQDKGRYIQISSEIAKGVGSGDLMKDAQNILKNDLKLPPTIKIAFTGTSEEFNEMVDSFGSAILLGVLFTYLILASLYESFITPFTILVSLPLAICGALFALFITQESINLISLLGIVVLISLATKSAIVLVDYTNQKMSEGKDRIQALKEACETRFRPILMSALATIIGMIPIALGMSEVASQRVSMGIVVIGGMMTATMFTLIIIPCVFIYIDRFRLFLAKFVAKLFKYNGEN
ncbi:MAG TPA: efflux RND transporter permease subunit [Rickettsiales bacterium]|nr:efflux RND transporter permease subunit [Rickettsiales bacterium]